MDEVIRSVEGFYAIIQEEKRMLRAAKSVMDMICLEENVPELLIRMAELWIRHYEAHIETERAKIIAASPLIQDDHDDDNQR